MPMTRPLGLTHVLPGEQSVSNEHATACTLESANTKTASLYFVMIFFMDLDFREFPSTDRGELN